MSKTSYTENFFSTMEKESVSSAEQIIPLVMNYVQPSSIIDVGCGNGTWLHVWKQKGVKVTGIDGDYVNRKQLLIDEPEFISHDLTRVYKSEKKYDLVSSLEVAEHIPATSAEAFVETLTGLGDIILFSAAIPGQGGTYHINEQYPDYWAQLFDKKGFVAVDCLRKVVWNNEAIAWWYRQNILFFVKKEKLDAYPRLAFEHQSSGPLLMKLVHPQLFASKSKEASYYSKNLKNPVRAVAYYFKKIIGK